MYKNFSLCKLVKLDGEVSVFEDKFLWKSIIFDIIEFIDFNLIECMYFDWLFISNLILVLDVVFEFWVDF